MSICPVEGCKNTMQRGRYCGTHYWRLRKYGDLHYQRPKVATIERGMGANAIRHREAKCIRGHDVVGENVYIPPSNPTWRQCKECLRQRTRENQRIRRARQKESA